MGKISANHRQMALIVALLLPAACAKDPEVGAVGIAVQRNIAFQAVDLDPHYAGIPIEGGNGQRSADAIKRYNSGTVKEPPDTSAGAGPKS